MRAGDRGIQAAVIFGVILVGSLLASCGGETQVAFKVCTRSDTWVRPSGLWYDARYLPLDSSGAPYEGNFFRHIGSPSISEPFVVRSGLTGFRESDTGACADEQTRHIAATRDAIEIWTLLYDVSRVEKAPDGFRLVVTAIEKGFRAIQFDSGASREGNVHIVAADGRELDCFGPESRGLRCE